MANDICLRDKNYQIRELPNRTLLENETCKYLDILEGDTIKQVDMKDKIQTEYLWRDVQADHRIKLKEREKKDEYLNFVRGLKKLWNMKVTIIPMVIGALSTITKGLLKHLEYLEVGGWVETIQMTTLLRMARILRRILETWGDLLSLKPQGKTIS